MMNTTIIVLLILLSVCILLLIIFYIQKQKKWRNRNTSIDYNNSQIDQLEKHLDEITSNYQKLLQKKFKTNQALVDFLKLKNYKYELEKDQWEQKARQIILEAIDNNVHKVVNETSTTSIKIDEKIKPRLIGIKGKNIDFFKKITRADMKVEQNVPFVTINCPNSIRRHLAVCTFKHMLKSDAFDQKSIENIYKKEAKMQKASFAKIGKDYIVNKLKFNEINPQIYEYVGRLHYRTSYSQNVLGHCFECAILAEKIAYQLHLNPYLAKMGAFFHDIGKSLDQEDGSFDHVTDGVKIAIECDLPAKVIEVIKNHHNKYHKDPYVIITRIADTISAGTEGARTVNQDVYTKAKIIEDLCHNNKFVYAVKTIKNNNFIKVIVIKNFHYKISNEELQKQLQDAFSQSSELKDFSINFSFQEG